MPARKKMTLEEKKKKQKEYQRKYREKNREQRREDSRKFRELNPNYRREYAEKNLKGTFEKKVRVLIYSARTRAKESGLRFSITEADLEKTEVCRLLEEPLDFSVSKKISPNSPTIDRIDTRLGYVPGNVQVISYRANRIKNDATFEEFEKIYLNWKKLEEERRAKRGKQLCLFDEPTGPGSST